MPPPPPPPLNGTSTFWLPRNTRISELETGSWELCIPFCILFIFALCYLSRACACASTSASIRSPSYHHPWPPAQGHSRVAIKMLAPGSSPRWVFAFPGASFLLHIFLLFGQTEWLGLVLVLIFGLAQTRWRLHQFVALSWPFPWRWPTVPESEFDCNSDFYELKCN